MTVPRGGAGGGTSFGEQIDGSVALAAGVFAAGPTAGTCRRAACAAAGAAAPGRSDAGRRPGTPAGTRARQPRVHGPAVVDRRPAGQPRRHPDRALPVVARAGRGRHGRGLAGRTRRWPVPAPGGPQAAAQWLCRPGPAPALQSRARDPGAAAASQPGRTARCRRRPAGPALPGAGVRGRRADHRLLPAVAAAAGTPPAADAAGVRGGHPRARQPDRAPRPEALQHPGHRPRRSEAARLRHRQAA